MQTMNNPQPFPENLDRLRQLMTQITARARGALLKDAREAQARLELLSVTPPRKTEESRLATLYSASRILGASLDLGQALSQVMDAVIQLTGAGRGFLMLIDRPTGKLDLQAARNFERRDLEKEEMQFSNSVVEEVLCCGKGIVTSNAQTDARFSEKHSILKFSLRSILCVPLRVHGEIIGVVYVDNSVKSGIFDQDDLEMLDALANQAAVAIENARLYTQTDAALAKRVEELETLQEVDRELNLSLDQDRVFELTLRWAIRGADAEGGWIAMRMEDKPTMTVVAGDGEGLSFPFQKDSAIEQAPANIGNLRDFKEEPSLSQIALPINRENEIIAILTVYRKKRPFSMDEKSFLQRLAEHAAIAIENARLFHVAQAANLAKSHFITLVSHELRLPMTAICGYADLIQQGVAGPINEKQEDFLNTIRKNVDRMETLVSDLSDISRIESGQMDIILRDLPISDIIHETVESMAPQFEGKNQAIRLDLPSTLPEVQADASRVEQILTNLLNNANKYTPDGGEISVQVREEKGCLHVNVIDNGIGISKADQASLFSQFFRSDDPAVRRHQGWGLGLHVAYQLAQRMGGDIGFQSEYGKGSTFWFILPTSQQSLEEAGNV
jgi:K+-sensing histidine kinase KdpD